MQHKITRIPDWVTDDEAYLNELGKEGWELIHLYNQHAYMKAASGGTIGSGSLTTQLDAFGRGRVSEPFTLGDYKHLYAVDESFIDYKVSGSTNTFSANRACMILTTSASAASRVVHQTKMYHNYMPGKSQVVLSSFVFGAAQPGVIKRTGYFDDYDGIFFEQDQTGSLNFVIRSSTNGTGSIQENRVKQTDWNVNTLLGGDITLDITKSQLLYLDFQWLGVGRVRCGLVINGVTILCHVFDHTNKSNVVYMANPNLPIRCEVRNTTTVTGSMEQICGTVFSEGGYAETGTTWASSTPTLRTITSASTMPVIAIRLKNTYNGLPNRAFVRLEDTSVFSKDQAVKYKILRLDSGSISTGAWISVDSGSTVEYNITATGYTDGHEFLNGFVAAGGAGVGNTISGIGQRPSTSNKVNYITQNYDSTNSEIYAVVVTNMTSTSTDVGAGIVWKEIY